MKVAFINAAHALEREGCDAAGYRLAGDGPDKHLDNDRSRDIYTRLYDALDVDPPAEPRDKPPC